LPCMKMLACLYCLGKGKACSLESPAEESCKADADGDLKEAGMAKVMASTSAAVMVQMAEVLEAMEEVQAMEEAEGSFIEPSPVPEERAKGDHAEGMLWQQEEQERELREVTADYVTLAAEEAVARALGEGSDVEEVLGASAMELETVPRRGESDLLVDWGRY